MICTKVHYNDMHKKYTCNVHRTDILTTIFTVYKTPSSCWLTKRVTLFPFFFGLLFSLLTPKDTIPLEES